MATKSKASNTGSKIEMTPAPSVMPTEVRGIRPTDVGGIVYLWSVRTNTGTWRSTGSYEAHVIVSVAEGGVDSTGQNRVDVELRRIKDGRYRTTGFVDTMFLLADGSLIPMCSEFDRPMMMVAAPK